MAKKQQDKPLYDEYGHWVEERGRIKGAIRRVFRLSPQMKDVIKAARVELPPALKKDGTPGKRNQVRFRCAICNDLFSQKNIQVDHIDPVVPMWESESRMQFDNWVSTIARGIFCKKENLQVVCSTPMVRNNGNPSCHKLKTDEENYVRRQLAKVMNLKDHTGEEIDRFIDDFKIDYQTYLKEKEAKKKAKKTRKRKQP